MRKIRYPIYLPPQETIDIVYSAQTMLAKKILVQYGKEKLLCTLLDIDSIAIVLLSDELVTKASAVILFIVDLDEEQVEYHIEHRRGRPPKKRKI